MKKFLYFIMLAALSSCSNVQEAFNAKDILSKMEGPKVPTVQETLAANAKSAEQQGEWATAIQLYQQLLEKEPENITYMLALAESYRRIGQYSQAVAVYDMALGKNPGLIEAKEGKGLAFLSKGDFEAPITLFEDVMKTDKNRWKTLNGLGILFAARGLQPEAIQYFKQALTQSPGNTSIMNNIGLSQALGSQFDLAADTLLQAGALATANGMDRKRIDLNLALVYAVAGKMENAQMIAENYYSGAQLNNNMGLYAHLAKDNQMAKDYLNMALTQSKTFYEKAWDNLQQVSASDTGTLPTSSMEEKAPAAGTPVELKQQ